MVRTTPGRSLSRFPPTSVRATSRSSSNFNLLPVLTAYENVEYPLLLLGLGATDRRERAMAMLESVRLADQRDQRPNQPSGGQRQRVAIARALVKRPVVGRADEPTANLDSRTGAEIIALMREVQEESAASFVFSTHDPQLMSRADDSFVSRDGWPIATSGSTGDLPETYPRAF